MYNVVYMLKLEILCSMRRGMVRGGSGEDKRGPNARLSTEQSGIYAGNQDRTVMITPNNF